MDPAPIWDPSFPRTRALVDGDARLSQRFELLESGVQLTNSYVGAFGRVEFGTEFPHGITRSAVASDDGAVTCAGTPVAAR